MTYKFLIALLILVLAFLLQFSFGEAAGVWINFSLAALIVASFVLSFSELLLLVLLSVFVINWQPAFSLEILIFGLVPFLSFSVYGFFLFAPRLGSILATFFGFLFFYLILGPGFILLAPRSFLADVTYGTLFGTAAFYVFEKTARVA